MNGIRRHAVRGLQAAVIAVLLAACGGGGGGGGNGSGAAAGPTAAGTIGPAGGEVAFADGRFRLAIPAGALAAPTAITVTELNAASVPQSLRALDADRVYRLEPAGTRFAVPATATVVLPASPGGALPVMVLESDGNGEYPASQAVSLSSTGSTSTGSVAHFSHLVVKTVESFTVSLGIEAKTIAVGSDVVADLTIAKTASDDNGRLSVSSFSSSRGPIAVKADAPPGNVFFDRNVARTERGLYRGTCQQPGAGFVKWEGALFNFFVETITLRFLSSEDEFTLEFEIADDYQCVEGSGGGSTVATGVHPAPLGLTKLDGVRVFKGPFANLGEGWFAAFAGAEGTVVSDLITGLSAIDWTPGGSAGAKVGQNLIGAMPVRQSGEPGKAAFLAYGNGGTGLTNYVQAIAGFGATMVGNAQVLDASTAGGGIGGNAFATIGAQGALFYGWDPVAQLYGGRNGLVPPQTFDGQPVSIAWPHESGPVLVVTRQASAGTQSKLYSAPSTGGPATLLAAIDSAQARRLRCIADEADASVSVCFITLFGGEAKVFRFDPTATTPPALVSVATGAGSLGIDQVRLANGNVLAVVANFEANSLTVIETSPGGTTVLGTTTVPAPAGCLKPAHVSLFLDDDGHLKAVVSCHGSDSYWVHRAA